jgi:signal transduction histidine kinase
LDKLFDPFFTTKPEDKGTGLGLSVCYTIIEKHSGTLEVESEHGHGATFIIDLPYDLSCTEEPPVAMEMEI